MNLSEKLNLNYCDTTCITKQIQEYLDRCRTMKEKYPDMEFDILARPESPYYACLEVIKTKQDHHEVVTDDEYRSIPNCGMAYFWSAAEGYYLVNFHYNFFYSNYNNRADLLYKFMDFLAVVDFTLCKETEVINWADTFKLFSNKLLQNRPDLANKCEFVISILEAIDPIKDNNIGSLLNIDRSIDPNIFDNAVRYFRAKESHYNYIEDKYSDKSNLKAKDVMEILNISRRTLTRYVKENKLIIDSTINGQYRYNKQSVFNVLRNNKINL